MEELNIYQIQGEGSISPLVDQSVTVTGIVTGDFQNGDGDDSRNLGGFYIQDAMGDNNPLTSDGIFVFEGDLITDVNVGDQVTVNGTVAEFFGETQISALTVAITGNGSIESTAVQFPLDTVANSNGQLIADFEPYEGMLVTLPDTLSVTEFFNLDRFGEIKLAQGGRAFQFTNQNAPSVEGFAQENEDFGSRTIMLDDGLTSQNPDPIIYPAPSLASDNTVRIDDTVTNLTGNIRFSRGSGGSGEEIFRIMPTVTPEFVSVNQRPLTPEDVGGSLKVVNFNVLNFFTTLDENDNTTGPDNTLDPRGADNIEEFNRQTEKLITALTQLDADVIGLAELENNGFATVNAGNSITGKSAIATLVDELNEVEGAGTYAFVDPGTDFLGSDAIMVGFIYNTNTVSIDPNSTIAFLTDDQLEGLGLGGSAPLFEGFATSRVPLATTFVENATGEKFTAVINHLKSKGSSGLDDVNDPNFDQGDGQGFWNQRRLESAQAIDAWLQTDPTNSGDTDVLIMGDLNSYLEEDPITFLESQGYENLLDQVDNSYSFVFSGRSGSLDHALATGSLAEQVTGITEWHINADEPDALDYNLDFGRNPDLFDGSIPFRVSDHDPVIVGLNLETIDFKIASGDVDQDSAVLWAKSDQVGDLTFEVSPNADFSNIVITQVVNVANSSVPVKLEIDGLEDNTEYFYRAITEDNKSRGGRFVTAGEVGEYNGFNFGIAGDWQQAPPYPILKSATESQLDVFVKLGDTIYADLETPALPGVSQARTLEDFRIKHNEVLSPRFGLSATSDLYQTTSILATIDDHEIVDNFAGGAAPGESPDAPDIGSSDQPLFTDAVDFVNDTQVYEDALQAYQEYHPLRDEFYNTPEDVRLDGERKLYRANNYGSDASIFMLDSRSFRDAQLPPADLANPTEFLVDAFDPSRTLLGKPQLEQLKTDLLASQEDGVTWKFVVIPEPIQNFGVVNAEDRFEGYNAERTELLSFIDQNAIENVVFMAGDFHGTIVNNLTYQTAPGGEQVATGAFEVVTGPVAFFDGRFGPSVASLSAAAGLITEEQLGFYNSLPVAPDAGDIIDDKDDFIKQVLKEQTEPLGYDPVGLDLNLSQAEGLIDATLLQGDYVAVHNYSWTEFDIDADTQALTVTTYGIDAYSEQDFLDNPAEIVNLEPSIISQFVVNPRLASPAPSTLATSASAGNDNLDSAFADNGFTGDNQLLFTGSGMDTIDISQAGSNSRIDTGSGYDTLFAGTNNRIILGDGDDKLFISTSGGGNRITGGEGADQFWLYTDEGAIPHNPNIISDFNPAEDVIGFLNTTLSLGSSDFSYSQDGSDVVINAFGQNVGILLNTTIADGNFVFA